MQIIAGSMQFLAEKPDFIDPDEYTWYKCDCKGCKRLHKK